MVPCSAMGFGKAINRSLIKTHSGGVLGSVTSCDISAVFVLLSANTTGKQPPTYKTIIAEDVEIMNECFT